MIRMIYLLEMAMKTIYEKKFKSFFSTYFIFARIWIIKPIYSLVKKKKLSRKHISIYRDMHYYIHRSGFEPRILHLFTLPKVNYIHQIT